MEFTEAEKEMLRNRVQTFNLAQAQLNEFVGFLGKQHKAPKDSKIKADLSGFEEQKKGAK